MKLPSFSCNTMPFGEPLNNRATEMQQFKYSRLKFYSTPSWAVIAAKPHIPSISQIYCWHNFPKLLPRVGRAVPPLFFMRLIFLVNGGGMGIMFCRFRPCLSAPFPYCYFFYETKHFETTSTKTVISNIFQIFSLL